MEIEKGREGGKKGGEGKREKDWELRIKYFLEFISKNWTN